jgi:hypothetical protein
VVPTGEAPAGCAKAHQLSSLLHSARGDHNDLLFRAVAMLATHVDLVPPFACTSPRPSLIPHYTMVPDPGSPSLLLCTALSHEVVPPVGAPERFEGTQCVPGSPPVSLLGKPPPESRVMSASASQSRGCFTWTHTTSRAPEDHAMF